MKRSFEDQAGGEVAASKVPRVHYTYAFKLLAPDALAAAILGARGTGIQEIQALTESKISIGNRNEKYHNTNMRLVLIRGNGNQIIDAALEAICIKLKGLVDAPKKGEADFADILAKNGEFRLKCVLPRAAAGALIGAKGANVALIREETGCRVRVEDGKIDAGSSQEQIVSLLGSIESLHACLQRVNVLVQDLANQDYFQDWAHLKQKPSPGATAPIPQAMTGRPVTVAPRASRGGQAPTNPMLTTTNAPDSIVHRALQSVPAGMMNNRTFAVQASLPVDSMSALIGKAGHHTKLIAEQTGAKVTLRDEDPNTVVTIEGSLNSVLGGYVMVMKKYLEHEQGGGSSKSKGRA